MHDSRTALALTAALALAGCQTMNGMKVNGMEIVDGKINNAQLGNVCGTDAIVCIVGGLLIIGGAVWMIAGGDDEDEIPE